MTKAHTASHRIATVIRRQKNGLNPSSPTAPTAQTAQTMFSISAFIAECDTVIETSAVRILERAYMLWLCRRGVRQVSPAGYTYFQGHRKVVVACPQGRRLTRLGVGDRQKYSIEVYNIRAQTTSAYLERRITVHVRCDSREIREDGFVFRGATAVWLMERPAMGKRRHQRFPFVVQSQTRERGLNVQMQRGSLVRKWLMELL